MSTETKLYFYNRVEEVPNQEDKNITEQIIFRDSFPLNKVLRTIQVADNLVVVVLDDWHEEKVSFKELEKGRLVEKTEKRIVNTQIPIDGVDEVKRFFEALDK